MAKSLLYLTVLLGVAFGQQSGPICPSTDAGYDAEVLILGAGVAGISAAKTLAENGMSDFLVIEANDRVGGRIRSEMFEGVQVELGSHSLYQIFPEHPLFPFVAKCGLQGNYSNYFDLFLYNGSNFVSFADAFTADSELVMALFRAQNYSRSRQAQNLHDISLQEGLEAVGYYSNTTLRHFFSFWYLDIVYGEHFRSISLYDWASRFNIQPSAADYSVTDQRGFPYFLECISSMFNFTTSASNPDRRLRLNTRVSRVNWSDRCVCVDTVSNGATASFCGKKAIITFSIGVLKYPARSLLTFNPPLPQWKKDVINHFNMSLLHKAFVKFNTTFWDQVEFIGRLDETRGQFNVFTPLSGFNGKFPGIPETTNILLVSLIDEVARNFTSLTNDQLKKQIGDALRNIYPAAQFEITNVLMVDWEKDPLALGAWSHFPIGTSDATVGRLAEPVGNLYFSGEAISDIEQGFVQGAYLAGNISATMVIGTSGTGSLVVTSSLLVALMLAITVALSTI